MKIHLQNVPDFFSLMIPGLTWKFHENSFIRVFFHESLHSLLRWYDNFCLPFIANVLLVYSVNIDNLLSITNRQRIHDSQLYQSLRAQPIKSFLQSFIAAHWALHGPGGQSMYLNYCITLHISHRQECFQASATIILSNVSIFAPIIIVRTHIYT